MPAYDASDTVRKGWMQMENQIQKDNGHYTLVTEDDETIELEAEARIIMDGRIYLLLKDDEDEGGLMVFRITQQDGEEFISCVEDDRESEMVFYYYEACSEDYEFCDAE